MSFTNVMKYGLVSQGGVACIPDAAYVPQLPTLAANDYRTRLSGNWGTASNWEIYNGSTWETASYYPTQNTGSNYGYINILYSVTLGTVGVVPIDGLIQNALIVNSVSKYFYVNKNWYLNSNEFRVNSARNLYGYFRGDLVFNSGKLNGIGNLYIYLDGNKLQQYYNTGSTTITGKVNFTVENNSIFKMDNYIIPSTCTGTFTLGAGCGLIIGSPSGITSSGAIGNIQSTGARTFNTGADYTYNMSNGTQYTGNGLPTTVRNLSFTGCNKTIVLSNNITVTGTYTLNPSVKVNLNGYTLTLP